MKGLIFVEVKIGIIQYNVKSSVHVLCVNLRLVFDKVVYFVVLWQERMSMMSWRQGCHLIKSVRLEQMLR